MTYEEIKNDINARSIDDWYFVLDNLQKCTAPKHTVAHLPYCSSWIFTTGLDCRWCMDPAPQNIDDTEALAHIAAVLADFDFCIISHTHGDHYDRRLVKMLRHSQKLRWILPAFMAEQVKEECQLDPSMIVALREGETFEHKGISIKAFPGFHGTQLPSASFLVTLPDGLKLAFPVDVRNYDMDILAEMKQPDWLFSHLWLGRKASHLPVPPLLEDFCRFNLDFKPGNIIIGHLNETRRNEDSMWTYRHWNLVKNRLNELAPEITVLCPKNGAGYLLSKRSQPDWFAEWDTAARLDFARHLGISLHGDIAPEIDKLIQGEIKVLELRYNVLDAMDRSTLLDCLQRWRDAGGECLSVHLPEVFLEEERPDFLKELSALGANRATLHVPRYPLDFVRDNWDKVLNLFTETVRPLTENGIIVGIENMHTKPGRPIDDKRRYGLIIPEWLDIVHALREKCGANVGCHLDVGHAYTNFPFHQENTLDTWMQAGANLINGLHIHQYEMDRSQENPFPDGHRLISGRTAGFPLLEPLFRHWQLGTFHCPVIIEMRNRYASHSYPSHKRLLDAWPCE